MKVNVKFLANVRDATETSEDTVDLEGNAVSDVIDALISKYGDRFRQEVLQPDGNINQTISVLLNGFDIRFFTESLQSVVKEGDTLHFLPAMLGG